MKPSTLFILIILVLLIIVTIQYNMYSKKTIPTKTTITIKDTVWLKTDTAFIDVPKLVCTKPVHDTVIVPNDSLRSYYNRLYEAYNRINVFSDTIKRDSNLVYITDTVTRNMIKNRGYKLSFNTPIINNTTIITVPTKQTTKVFIGGGIEANKQFQQVNLGLSVLNRPSTTLINVYTGVNTNGNLSIGFNTYWKISLKK